jgi:uncharacterized protein YndB with AHSA1/START domain
MATQKGYFLIADITGYTQYLSASELDHAQQILTTLLNLLIKHTKPPLIISRLAGDAVISYGLADSFLTGQTFVEMLETTYVAFRRAIDLMVRNTTCPCNACRNIPSLDLKFFVHYGEFGVQKLDAHDELIGSDVNLLHRLLKNSVKEQTGIAAYTLYTEAATKQLGLDSSLGNMVAHEETYEHLGPVKVSVQDMHTVWEREKDKVQLSIAPDRTLIALTTDIALPPELIWDYLGQPAFFNVLVGGNRIEIEDRKAGRIAQGSVFQCYHGDNALVSQVVLEWHPFERLLLQFVAPVPVKGVTGMVEVRLEPIATGTRMTQTFSKAQGPLAGRLMADIGMRQMMQKSGQADLDRFRDRIQADWAEHGGTPAGGAPPEAAIGAAALESLSAARSAVVENFTDPEATR